ncbi:hypothetical protein G5I_04784 [Acromyrmex echinatior]|uniref:Uncharacterized protein n=1 Tax=Acromyrmex echinatior TaxID=103372 RepID=F4WGK3_ACREC|nr:hypothetical protein G5I_04784 [Acromyrmex echinatior]
MEDGKPATVRELTTFFRFSRGGGCAERAVGVDEWKKWKERKAEAAGRAPLAREETPTKGLRQHGSQKLDQRGDVLPHH